MFKRSNVHDRSRACLWTSVRTAVAGGTGGVPGAQAQLVYTTGYHTYLVAKVRDNRGAVCTALYVPT